MSKHKRWSLALVALLLAGALWQLLRPAPLTVETALLERRALTVTVDEQGRTRALDPYVLAAPVPGRLLRIELDEGDAVQAGQVLGHIAPAPEDPRSQAVLRAALDAAAARQQATEAELREAESAAASARREQERRDELFKNGQVSAEERDSFAQSRDAAEARLLATRAAGAVAAAELESARARLLGLEEGGDVPLLALRAPVDGQVFRVFERSERVLAAGTPLLSLSAPRELELVIDLLTQDAVQVKAGDPILVSGWGGEDVLHGVVRTVEPEAFTKISALGVEEQRVNVIGDLLDAPPVLGAGYRIEAAIVVWEEDEVLVLPGSALFQRDGRWLVYAVSPDGRAALRELRLGRRNTQFAQVLEGLSEGERVVLFPSDLLREGARVKAAD